MAEIDLVPADYRRRLQLRRRLGRFGATYAVLLVAAALAAIALSNAVRVENARVDQLRAAESVVRNQRGRLTQLEGERDELERTLRIQGALVEGRPAFEALVAVDRALDANVWFLELQLERTSELAAPEQARESGEFIRVTDPQDPGAQRAWRMRTRLHIRAQALDHASLAGFVARLSRQPEIREARVLETEMRRYASTEVVDFELSVVVESPA
jgi:hypothetical protein